MGADHKGLRVRSLSVSYRTPRGLVRALRNVSIDVPPGMIVGIVGESGCGKSSLISSIMRLLPENAIVAEGSIEFEDQELLKLSADEMRQIRGNRISVVFQDPMTSLNPVRSIGKQLMDVQYRRSLDKSEKQRRAIEMLERVGIPDAADRLRQFAHQFSGGMLQRVSIAMALMGQPALLIADEPTTALDATLEVQIIRLLKSLQEEVGCAILFVSHHLGVIAELCDYVVVLYAGEVVESGTVRDIFHRSSHPYTRRLLECDPGRLEHVSRHLPTIRGELPDMVNLPLGCIFATRCPDQSKRCHVERPRTHEVRDLHRAACHLLELEKART